MRQPETPQGRAHGGCSVEPRAKAEAFQVQDLPPSIINMQFQLTSSHQLRGQTVGCLREELVMPFDRAV